MKQQTFSVALDALKDGKTVARYGWNSNGAYIFVGYGKDITDALHKVYGGNSIYKIAPTQLLDAIYMKTEDNKLVPWLPSHIDLLSDDWVIVPY